MSIKVMTWIWDNADAKGSELLLLLALADFAADDGYCWPTISTLAEKTRLSERQVFRLLQKLEDAGELTVIRGRRNNRYIVNTDKAQERIEKVFRFRTGDKMAPDKTQPDDAIPDKMSPDPDKMSPSPDMGVTLTVNEPSPEPSTPSGASAPTRSDPEPNSLADELAAQEPAPRESIPDGMSPSEWLREKTARAHNAWIERTGGEPWIGWGGDGVRTRDGVSVAALRRTGWLLEQETGLAPVDGELTGWVKALAMIYQAAGGDWDVIRAGIREVWRRERRYRPGHARGFVNEVRKAATTAAEPDPDANVHWVNDPPPKRARSGPAPVNWIDQ